MVFSTATRKDVALRLMKGCHYVILSPMVTCMRRLVNLRRWVKNR